MVRGRGSRSDGSEVVPPGRPRLVLAAGGHVDAHSPQAAGTELTAFLPAGCSVIGRARDVAVRLADTTVSPRHAEVTVSDEDGRVRVRDLGSRNGTLVNGLLVSEAELSDGSRIEVGNTTLVVVIDDQPDDGDGGAAGED